jgi:lysophospholipase L1-like esterase
LAKDGLYGLGGVTFSANSGVIARFGTIDEGAWGRKVSRFEVSYLARPGGGMFELSVDGQHHQNVDTNAETTEVRRAEVSVPDGPHLLELRTRKGETRGFGVVLERESPGVVLDALGIQGARIRFLDEQDDAHFQGELRWRRPDLVVYQFGANESADGYAYSMEDYLRTMKAVIAQGKEALPNSSCLIVAAMDRARLEGGVVTSMKIIPLIVEQQAIAARDLDCAFFNTYEAMGGWGAMPKWVRRGLGQADMTHPSGVGAIRIGTWIYGALMEEYDRVLRSPAPD